jgi:hypothetical protein
MPGPPARLNQLSVFARASCEQRVPCILYVRMNISGPAIFLVENFKTRKSLTHLGWAKNALTSLITSEQVCEMCAKFLLNAVHENGARGFNPRVRPIAVKVIYRGWP